MKIKTERRKQIREALQQGEVWWQKVEFMDSEAKRLLNLKDKPREMNNECVPSSKNSEKL